MNNFTSRIVTGYSVGGPLTLVTAIASQDREVTGLCTLVCSICSGVWTFRFIFLRFRTKIAVFKSRCQHVFSSIYPLLHCVTSGTTTYEYSCTMFCSPTQDLRLLE